MRLVNFSIFTYSSIPRTTDCTTVDVPDQPAPTRLDVIEDKLVGLEFRYNYHKEMSSVANVERKIRRIEGFRARILHLSGADVRGDREGLPQYGYHRAADNDITVETWKESRFRPRFPGFEVDVVDRRGRSVQGNTKLGTVRETYRRK